MQVTGLKIAGFKSFVDPVDVPVHEGLTGIVGPNGCGKSNLLEALRWAMGATSARAMRGGEMDDLIFAGTTERPAREIAEVVLMIDNRERTAPAEFNEEDVLEIRRTLRRGAGSSYRINGRTVRAKDVQILFADASTGANSPSLVRQGQISELISAKPQNRRRILEEAAGIGGLAARRHEAELKLKAAEENLAKLADIMAEVERQAASLKRQAGKARRYRALSEEIQALEARLGATRWRGAVKETAEARKALAAAKEAEAEAVSAVARANAAELDARAAIDPLRNAEADAAGRLGALKLQLARTEAERDAARDHAVRIDRDIARIEEETAREQAEQADAGLRMQRAIDTLAALPPDDAAARKAEHDRLLFARDAAHAARTKAELDADAARMALAQADVRAATGASAIRREEDRIARLDAELARLRRELGALGDAAVIEAALETARARSIEAARQVEQAQAALTQANRALDAARGEEAKLTPPVHATERRVVELEAELKGLDRLLRRHEGPAPVMDSISAKGLERALAAALDADLEAPVDPAAPAHWSGRHGRTAMPLPDGATPLSDIVQAPDVMQARLSQCGLVDRDKGAALQPGLSIGQRLVSREGDLWRWDGFVRSAEAPLPTAERMAQRTRREECQRDLVVAQKDRDAALAARNKASAALTNAEMAAMEARRRAPEAQRNAAQTREAALRAEQDVERLSLRGASLRDSVARLETDHRHAVAMLGEAREASSAMPTDADRAHVAAMLEAMTAAREAERHAAQDFDAFVRETERAEAVRSGLKLEQQEWAGREAAAAARLLRLVEQLEAARDARVVAAEAPAKAQARLDELAAGAEAAETARREAADALAAAGTVLREAEFATRNAREQSANAREGLARSDARLEAAIRREAEIAETVRAAFDRELEDLEALVAAALAQAAEAGEDAPGEAPDPAVLDIRLAQLRRERDGLGAVNMEADDQLAEIAARMGFQAEERDDLIAAIARLREGIDALNEEGRSRLVAAYESVNTHFRSLFTALFGGGEAELRLTESEDPLDAGLEIYASPPGKRLATLSLMSGGEQALTATALIFAVFLSRPSPICVLDEVDAPLDDANVDRFCRLLDEMRKRTATRFIVITHNAVTMSRMDRLFGVTMQERGVSRLVSVDLEAAERLAAA